ncbi:tripartite tricarboxylate transporter substrate binding protein [Marispirochaeta aestuarii]|uniref:tripartite tricarboxylate transporter substrate binding protein n=1 Tax=Marispirochaeta aestuarii TaxID=1963862 RepID=UPI0029C928E5|nr:tripartite tricarboxylate transporter substrate binding protein [Marispirochaeta aestuarii]
MKKRFFTGLVAALLVLAFALPVFAEGAKEGGATAPEWPTRPITVMLGWSAGGTSDTTARAVAQEMSEYLGVEIKITNMEGANGGIAYQNVYQAESDGYRWFGGAQVQATYPITRQAKVGWEEFYPFPAGMGATTIYVRTDSGYDDITDLVDAIKRGNKVVKYGTTSRGGNGSIFGEVFAQAAGIADKVQEVPYNGGREAGRYLLSGDVEYISVSLGDVSDWAEEGRIKPVLNLYDKDYVWRGVTFPTVNKYYPELEVYMSINPYWGIAVKRDTPEAVIEKMAEAFVYAVKQDRFKAALESRGIIVNPKMGDAADEAAAIVGAGRGWAQYDYGIVDVSPETLGIPRVTDWEWPYNETSANIRPWPAKAEELYESELAD